MQQFHPNFKQARDSYPSYVVFIYTARQRANTHQSNTSETAEHTIRDSPYINITHTYSYSDSEEILCAVDLILERISQTVILWVPKIHEEPATMMHGSGATLQMEDPGFDFQRLHNLCHRGWITGLTRPRGLVKKMSS